MESEDKSSTSARDLDVDRSETTILEMEILFGVVLALARPRAMLEAMVPHPKNPTERLFRSRIVDSWIVVSSRLLVYNAVGVEVMAAGLVGGVVGKEDGAP